MQTKPSVDRLISRVLAIEDESVQDAKALGFVARAMVQATLPHKKVEGNTFERRNGKYTLTLLAVPKIGLPYGSIPRLILAWLTTEAVKTKSRELELGDSLSSFMKELGLNRTGGERGDITRLKEQARRLFSCSISAIYEDEKRSAFFNQSIASKAHLWWDAKDVEKMDIFKSSVTLAETFFAEIMSHPIPVDVRALAALKKSPLALDIYCWLTYRASYAKRPSVVPWDVLALQFGSDYARLRDFKQAFLDELRKVAVVYWAVQFEVVEEGLLLKPALTHVAKKIPF